MIITTLTLALFFLLGTGTIPSKAQPGVISADVEAASSNGCIPQPENFSLKKSSSINDRLTATPKRVFSHAMEGHFKPGANRFRNNTPNYCTIDYHHEYIDVTLDLKSISTQLNVDKNDVLDIVALEFPYSTDYGEPNLPFDVFRVLLPENTDVSSVEVEILDQVLTGLEGRYYLPPNVPGATHHGDLKGFDGRKNDHIYRSDSFFPLQHVTIEPAHLSGGTFGVLFNVFPFTFNPVEGKVRQLDNIRIRINYKEDPLIEDNNGFNNQDDFFDHQYQSLTSSAADSGFVIITTSSIVEHSEMLELFISLKDKQGFEVYTITEDDYDSVVGQAPNERADRIRQWLIENREALSIRYALLIGDPTPSTGDVPMKMLYPRYGTTHHWNTYAAPSDFYYSNLSGNWDLDGDEMYGEQMSIDGAISPDPLIDPDEFSIRWTGQYEVVDEDGVRLAGFFDDGCRVWLDGELVIDKWYDHLAGSFYLDIETPGIYDIIIEYYKADKNAFFYLFQGAIGSTWFGNVHIDKLYYWDGDSYIPGGLLGYYYDDANLTDLVFSRIDPPEGVYNFRNNWMTGDRGEGGVCFNPDIIVGRIPVYNNSYDDLDNILLKSILYHTSDESLWRQSALLPMKPFDSNTPNYQLGEQIREELCLPNDFSTYRIYDEEYDCDPPPDATPCSYDNVLQAWTSQPFGLTVWATHGSGTTASHIITSSNCSDLSNDHPAIVIQGSCHNGRPENSYNLGYSLLKDGAVATISGSRVTWYGIGTTVVTPDNRWIHGYCYHTANHLINGENVGSALHQVKDVSADAASNYIWMNTFGFNLYGIPTIKLSPLQNIHVILAAANDSNVGSIVGDGVYYDGEIVTLYASPMTGYDFVEWQEDGEVVMDGGEPAGATYTFTAEANRDLTAYFICNTIAADFQANKELSLTGNTISFSSMSQGLVTGFEWSFPGGNPSSSFIENPEVVYNEPGIYSVSLTVTGGPDGSLTDTKVITNYIRVYEPTCVNNYCEATHGYDYAWISRVVLNDIDNQTTGWPDNGYSDFAPTHITELVAGSEYNLSVELSYTNSPDINIGIWLDHGQDTSFMTEGDILLIAHPPQLEQLIDAVITIPLEAVNGVTRLRIRANYRVNQVVLPCGHDNYLGEVEDYSVLISGGTWKITSTTYPEDYGNVTGTGTFNDGDQVTLTALADTGYHFLHWTEHGEVIFEEGEVEGEPVGETYVFLAMQHRDLIAHFAVSTYHITAEPNNDDFGSVTGAGDYEHGQTVTLEADPAEGYHFVEWTENGDHISNDATYQFTAEEDRALVAVFHPDDIDIPIIVEIADESVSQGETVCLNALQTITISDYLVEAGGNATLIAGESIHLLTGTIVEHGGYLQARIAAHIGDYCGTPKAFDMAEEAVTSKEKDVVSTDFPHEVRENGFFKLYPNPTDGTFTLELTTAEINQTIIVEVHSMLGGRLFSNELPSQRFHTLSLEGHQSGMYIIRVMKGDKVGVERLIKR